MVSATGGAEGEPMALWQRIDTGTLPRSIGASLVSIRFTDDTAENPFLVFCGGWSTEAAAPMDVTLSVIRLSTLRPGVNRNVLQAHERADGAAPDDSPDDITHITYTYSFGLKPFWLLVLTPP